MLKRPVTTLCICLLFGAGGQTERATHAQSSEVKLTMYTYKHVRDLEIKADVLYTAHNVVRPVVVSIHGGALIMGHREQINWPMREQLLDAGNVIVSIDYRPAPETKLPEIIQDIRTHSYGSGRRAPSCSMQTRERSQSSVAQQADISR